MSDLREQASWDSSESSALDRAANTSATHGAYLDDLASVPYGKDATAFNMSEQGGCTHRAQAAAEPAQLVKRQSCVPGDITAAFGEIARQPTQYYIAVTVARVTYALCLALVWVVGWLFSDIYWPCVVPPAVNAMCVLIEVASVHTQGPMRHATSLFGRIALLLTIATFTFVTTLPIFLATPKKPFSHHYVQTAASCVLAFAGCIFCPDSYHSYRAQIWSRRYAAHLLGCLGSGSSSNMHLRGLLDRLRGLSAPLAQGAMRAHLQVYVHAMYG